MLAIPPYVLLIPYAVFLAFFAFFALANVLSLAKYGARNWIGFLASFIFVACTAFILFLTWQALLPMDWVTPVPLFGSSSVTTF